MQVLWRHTPYNGDTLLQFLQFGKAVTFEISSLKLQALNHLFIRLFPYYSTKPLFLRLYWKILLEIFLKLFWIVRLKPISHIIRIGNCIKTSTQCIMIYKSVSNHVKLFCLNNSIKDASVCYIVLSFWKYWKKVIQYTTAFNHL